MPKALCYFGMAVAGLLLVVFGLDLATGFPFGGASFWMNVGFLICSAVLAYISWSTLREQI